MAAAVSTTHLTTEWWDVGNAGVIWERAERGVGMRASQTEGGRWRGEVSAGDAVITMREASDLATARAFCDRWAAVLAREVGR